MDDFDDIVRDYLEVEDFLRLTIHKFADLQQVNLIHKHWDYVALLMEDDNGELQMVYGYRVALNKMLTTTTYPYTIYLYNRGSVTYNNG